MSAQAQEELKARHYTQQLYAALTRGAWAESAPANAAKGPPMSWNELMRKYRKHCTGRHITAELALQSQSLSLLLLPTKIDVKKVRPEDLDDDSEEPLGSLELGRECELKPERVEDARMGFAALELLNDTPEERDSTLFTRAYYAYALKKYKECFALLNPMNFDESINSTPSSNDPSSLLNAKPAHNGSISSKSAHGTVSSSSKSATTSNSEKHTSVGRASIDGGQGMLGVGAGGTHLTWTGSIASVDVDDRGKKMWRLVECVRGRCLQGMSMEKLRQPTEALSLYLLCLPLLRNLRNTHVSAPLLNSNSQQSNKANVADPSFIKNRELWRWAERLLWRASILSSKYSSIPESLEIFRVYASHARYFPPGFRPRHRSVVTALHLQALLLTSPQTSTSGPTISIPGQTKLSWLTEARTLLGEYRLVLATTTWFPRAGERNVQVEEFTDAVIGVWERSGAKGNDTGWAIEIMWWATRMTFHSHRIFRHLVRLLHASGENELAKRTFKLYVQLVSKSRQASMGEVESTIRRRRTLDHLDNDPAVMGDIEPIEESTSADNDRQFVEAMIFGARMLCRLEGDVDDAKWATEVVEQAKKVMSTSGYLEKDMVLKARVCVADGIADSVLALREQDPTTRPVLMKRALNHIASAVNFNPDSADAYYHLAIALIQAGPTRDLDSCIRAARHAVELDSTEIRYWHLLGLALSADGQLEKAREILLLGEACQIDEDEDPPAEGDASISAPGDDKMLGDESRSESPNPIDTLISLSTKKVPSPTSMLLTLPDHPLPSKEDLFDHGLQLRMTLLALIEQMDGAEMASLKWVEVFAWFAERGGWAQPQEERRASFELPPIRTIPPSEEGHEMNESASSLPILVVTGERASSMTNLPSGGLPITIVPPSPGEHNGDRDSLDTVRMSGDKDKERESDTENERGKKRAKQAQRRIKEQIKEQVNKRQSQIQTISKKLGRSGTLRSQMSRAASTPDLSLLGDNSRAYQASSIHSRQRMSPRTSYIGTELPLIPPTPPHVQLASIVEQRTEREKRLIADLWLTSAATFRRMGKLEQARGAIQEAETLDEGHPGIWVQLGLYFVENRDIAHAIAAFHKALVINPDHIPAVVHLAQQYLNPAIGQTASIAGGETQTRRGAVDLAAGMLSSFTKGPGWDVPEAWYLLAKAVSLQGRKERERECLTYALGLVEGKPIRDIRLCLGYL